jgi:hypothetical protein
MISFNIREAREHGLPFHMHGFLAGRIQNMKKTRQWPCWCLAGLGLALTALTGCQTNVGGMTLPSGHYLEHPPQYIPPSPAFPLSRELASQEAAAAGVPNGAAVVPPLPRPIQ